MFKYTVEGEYVESGKLAQLSFYKTSIILAEENQGKALSVIQNIMLTDVLKKEIKDFKRWRTAKITDVKAANEDEAAKVDVDLEKAATEATELGAVPPNLSMYKKQEDKKKALEAAVEKKKAANAKREKKEAGKGAIDQGFID